MSLIRALSRPLVFAFGLQLLACAPALNWREVTVAETPLRLQLPCRAHPQERTLQLAGQRVLWRMLVCSAEDHTFAVAWADLGNPNWVAPALTELLAAAGANVGALTNASKPLPKPLLVPGATPHVASQQVLLVGRRGDGQAVQMQLALFTFGTAVFQVTALGPSVTPDVSGPLMDSLRFQP